MKKALADNELVLGQEYGYILVSACRDDWSADPKENAEINRQKTEELRGIIQSYGYAYVPVQGGFSNNAIGKVQEDSFFILNFISETNEKGDMDDLWGFGAMVCSEFNQSCFLYYNPSEGKPYYADKYGKVGDYKLGTIILNAPADKDGRERLTERAYYEWEKLDEIRKGVTSLLAKYALDKLSSFNDGDLQAVTDDSNNAFFQLGGINVYGDVKPTLFKGIEGEDDRLFDIWLFYESELKSYFDYDSFEASLITGEFASLAKALEIESWVIKDVMELYDKATRNAENDYLEVGLLYGVSQKDFESVTNDSLWDVNDMSYEDKGTLVELLKASNANVYCAIDLFGSKASSDENILYGDGTIKFAPAGTILKPRIPDIKKELKSLGCNV